MRFSIKAGAVAGTAALLTPFVAFAQDPNLGPFARLLSSALGIVNAYIIPLLVAVAVAFFFWGLIQYIRSSGEGHKEGVNTMVAGIVAIVIMLSLWGIVLFVSRSFGIDERTNVLQPPVVGNRGVGF